jgi:hypothetical protein
MYLKVVKANGSRSHCKSIDQICLYIKELIRQNKSNGVAPLHAAYETAVLRLH